MSEHICDNPFYCWSCQQARAKKAEDSLSAAEQHIKELEEVVTLGRFAMNIFNGRVVSENIGHRQRIAELERERDEARDLLRRAYNEAMDHDIDSRELDEKILALLGRRG